MALSPLVSRLALPLGRAWRSWRKLPLVLDRTTPAPVQIRDHIIVAGYGRSGRAAARVLQSAGIPLLVVEINHGVFGGLAEAGISGIWGDITSEEILSAAQIKHARILLLTVPHQNAIYLTVQRVRQLNPAVVVIARAAMPDQVKELRALGVDAVVQPEFEGGVEMVHQALARYGSEPSTSSRLIAEIRSEFYRQDVDAPAPKRDVPAKDRRQP